jgi:hypothetical protein
LRFVLASKSQIIITDMILTYLLVCIFREIYWFVDSII